MYQNKGKYHYLPELEWIWNWLAIYHWSSPGIFIRPNEHTTSGVKVFGLPGTRFGPTHTPFVNICKNNSSHVQSPCSNSYPDKSVSQFDSIDGEMTIGDCPNPFISAREATKKWVVWVYTHHMDKKHRERSLYTYVHCRHIGYWLSWDYAIVPGLIQIPSWDCLVMGGRDLRSMWKDLQMHQLGLLQKIGVRGWQIATY